jgi:hypothetical protein
MDRRNHWVAASLVVVSLGLAGCGVARTEYGDVSQGGPAKLQPIKGTDLHRVTLTSDAAHKLGVQTAATAGAAMPAVSDGTAAAQTVVPLAAIIYDKDGGTWVYTTTPGTLSYQRAAVSIARIDGDSADLTSGPAAGTQVVTVGAAELLGAELGVAGE